MHIHIYTYICTHTRTHTYTHTHTWQHSPVGPCDTLFDGARHLVYADAQGAASSLNRPANAPPPAGHTYYMYSTN